MEELHLKGYLSNGRQRYRVDKHLRRDYGKEKLVQIDDEELQVVAKITRRGINGTDRFRNARSLFGVALPMTR